MTIRLLALTFGFALVAGAAYAGPLPGGADTDSDGVEDAFDNCTAVSNTSQADADHNGCGDACSPPITCDGDANANVGPSDFALMLAQWQVLPAGSMDCDNNADVGPSDYAVLLAEWNNSVGPSGITSAQCNPATCMCIPQ